MVFRIYRPGRLNKKKLEIWGKAQREYARRPKSNWKKIQRVKFLR